MGARNERVSRESKQSSITLYNMCAVPWGCAVLWMVFCTVGDIMLHVGGYLEYRGGCFSTVGIMINVGDILGTVGDIMSTVGVFSTVVGYHPL